MATTLDPANTHADITLSNGNLTGTDTAGGTWRSSRSTTAKSSGAHRFSISNDVVAGGAAQIIIGVGNSSVPLTSYCGGADSNGIAYAFNGNIIQNATVLETVASYTTGDTVSAEINKTANDVQFYKNGSAVGSTRTLPAGDTYAFLSVFDGQGTCNFSPATNPWDAAAGGQARVGFNRAIGTGPRLVRA